MKSVAGGLLVQGRDNAVVDDLDLKVVTKRAPTEKEMADLKFAFRVAKHVKSNAIVYAKDLATVGIGAGQMSRVDSSRIAARKALDAAEAAGLAEPLTKARWWRPTHSSPSRTGCCRRSRRARRPSSSRAARCATTR